MKITRLERAYSELYEALGDAIMSLPGITRTHDSDLLMEDTFMKFMSDKGMTDEVNGIAFAKWLKKNKIRFGKQDPDNLRVFTFTPKAFLKLIETLIW